MPCLKVGARCPIIEAVVSAISIVSPVTENFTQQQSSVVQSQDLRHQQIMWLR